MNAAKPRQNQALRDETKGAEDNEKMLPFGLLQRYQELSNCKPSAHNQLPRTSMRAPPVPYIVVDNACSSRRFMSTIPKLPPLSASFEYWLRRRSVGRNLQPNIQRLLSLVLAVDKRLLDEIAVVEVSTDQIQLMRESAELQIDQLCDSLHLLLAQRAAFEAASRASTTSWTTHHPPSASTNLSCHIWSPPSGKAMYYAYCITYTTNHGLEDSDSESEDIPDLVEAEYW
ncbi:hypothetical protein R3P38DRAFT_2806527 [Favolaschia claudopus]|uniref:Uncharacterized protein n=1 Tax=Favolaschia claudopus TaxID=2862362 RepID=A0AAV9ZJX6_9AGAR